MAYALTPRSPHLGTLEVHMLWLLIPETLSAARSRWPEVSRRHKLLGVCHCTPAISMPVARWDFFFFFFLQLIPWLGNLEKQTTRSPSLQDRGLRHHGGHPIHHRCPGQSALGTALKGETRLAGPCSWDRCLSSAPTESHLWQSLFRGGSSNKARRPGSNERKPRGRHKPGTDKRGWLFKIPPRTERTAGQARRHLEEMKSSFPSSG